MRNKIKVIEVSGENNLVTVKVNIIGYDATIDFFWGENGEMEEPAITYYGILTEQNWTEQNEKEEEKHQEARRLLYTAEELSAKYFTPKGGD